MESIHLARRNRAYDEAGQVGKQHVSRFCHLPGDGFVRFLPFSRYHRRRVLCLRSREGHHRMGLPAKQLNESFHVPTRFIVMINRALDVLQAKELLIQRMP
jgi:hypothetical protein